MTQLLIASIGSYPRIGELKDQQRHRRGFTHFQNKEISAHAFRDVEQSVTQELIREQILCNLDEVTDGMASWADPISHFCKNTGGIRLAGLARYFDNNFYYRVPVFTAKPKIGAAVLVPEYQYAQSISSKPVRAVVTGPLTLAAFSKSETAAFAKVSARAAFFSDVIAAEIKALSAAGAQTIQVDEPGWAANPALFSDAAKVFQKLAAASSSRLELHLPFAAGADLVNKTKDFPFRAVHFDFTKDGKKLFDALLAASPKYDVGFGLINARNTRLEAVEPLIDMLRTWVERTQPLQLYATTSCGLEFLPRDTALAKLKLLARIKTEAFAGAARA